MPEKNEGRVYFLSRDFFDEIVISPHDGAVLLVPEVSTRASFSSGRGAQYGAFRSGRPALPASSRLNGERVQQRRVVLHAQPETGVPAVPVVAQPAVEVIVLVLFLCQSVEVVLQDVLQGRRDVDGRETELGVVQILQGLKGLQLLKTLHYYPGQDKNQWKIRHLPEGGWRFRCGRSRCSWRGRWPGLRPRGGHRRQRKCRPASRRRRPPDRTWWRVCPGNRIAGSTGIRQGV